MIEQNIISFGWNSHLISKITFKNKMVDLKLVKHARIILVLWNQDVLSKFLCVFVHSVNPIVSDSDDAEQASNSGQTDSQQGSIALSTDKEVKADDSESKVALFIHSLFIITKHYGKSYNPLLKFHNV